MNELRDQIVSIVENALREDIGPGDATSAPIIPSTTHLEGEFLVKADGIVAGLDVVALVFHTLDPDIVFALESGG